MTKRIKRTTGKWNPEHWRIWQDAKTQGDKAKANRWRNKIVTDNYPFAVSVANRYKKCVATTTEIEDMCQAGALGIMRALETYDPTRAAFSTYAAFFIVHEIQNVIHKDRKIRIPKNKKKKSERTDEDEDNALTEFEFVSVSKAANIAAEEVPKQEDSLDNVLRMMATLDPMSYDLLERVVFDDESLLKVGSKYPINRESVRLIFEEAKSQVRGRAEVVYREPYVH
jgi:RNA polymerase sigma factor (sigma-70 family)